MHTRAIIIAKGEVQRVGYRDVVERAARTMKLTGFVENTRPYDVKIVCEGDKRGIDTFIKHIKIKKYPIDVQHLDVGFAEATGEFDYFEIKRGDMVEELGERLDLVRVDMTTMIQKQDVMIEILTEHTSILKENNSILKEHTPILKENNSILKEFKSETNENFTKLCDITSRHDADAKERIDALGYDAAEIKSQLSRLESA